MHDLMQLLRRSPALLAYLYLPICLGHVASAQTVREVRLVASPLEVDLELSEIWWAVETTGGAIVFADGRANLVYVRDPGGQVRVLGGQGDGPGEYRSPSVGFLRGDSVVIHEVGLARREALHLSTGLGTSRRFLGRPVGLDCRVVLLMADRGVCEVTQLGEHGSGTNTLVTNWFHLGDGPDELREIQVAYDSAYVARLVHATGVLHVPRPYTWATRSALSPGGLFGVVLRQSLAGKQVAAELSIWTVADGSVKRLQRHAAAMAVPSADRRALVGRVVAELGRVRPQLLRQRAEFEAGLQRGWGLPAAAPAFAGVLVSDDGCVWLEHIDIGIPRFRPDRTYERWTISGHRLPTVVVDRDARLLSVGCDRAVGVRHDDNGVPTLLSLQVQR